MDLLKAITGKNPAEYEQAARILVNNTDVELFKKLVKQEDFLFDFVKNNVAKRIQNACNQSNFKNLYAFLDYYSPSYDSVIAEVLNQYGDDETFAKMKNLYKNGTVSQKSYAAKYFSFSQNDITDLMNDLRNNSFSDDEGLSVNSIEVLSKYKDEISKQTAISKLNSNDEFEQYEGVKFLVTYQDKSSLGKIIDVMKKSSLSENIASEIPFLIPITELLNENFDNGILVLCNIVNAIPEIIPPSAIVDYSLYDIFENLYYENLTGTSALLLRMVKDKTEALIENDEYLFDCDKNTKDEIFSLNKFLKTTNTAKLNSLLYEELYEDSDFVFFASDYADSIEELETLLDCHNQTLILKVLTILKDKQVLTQNHKEIALKNITNDDIKKIVAVL